MILAVYERNFLLLRLFQASVSLLRSRLSGCHATLSPKETAAHIRTTFLSHCVSNNQLNQ